MKSIKDKYKILWPMNTLFGRMDFIREYTLASMRLKLDKWNKIIISDEQRQFLTSFIEKEEPQQLVISQNIAGHLQVLISCYLHFHYSFDLPADPY